jgi:hypothetical protein
VLSRASAEAKGSGGSGSPGGDSAARRALSSIATVLEKPIVPKLWNLLSSFSVAFNVWQVSYRRLEEGVKFNNLSETLKSTSAEVFGGADASVPELKEKGVRGHVLALDKEIHGNHKLLRPRSRRDLGNTFWRMSPRKATSTGWKATSTIWFAKVIFSRTKNIDVPLRMPRGV